MADRARVELSGMPFVAVLVQEYSIVVARRTKTNVFIVATTS